MLDRVAYIVTQGVIFNLSIDQTTCLHCGFRESAHPVLKWLEGCVFFSAPGVQFQHHGDHFARNCRALGEKLHI